MSLTNTFEEKENIEAEKTAPKYTCIITSEADLPDKQLDYFSDNPLGNCSNMMWKDCSTSSMKMNTEPV